jgi:TP901 family phage tail tape measure protein
VAVVGLEFQVRSGNAVSETKKLTTATQQLEGAVKSNIVRLRDSNGRFIKAGESAAQASKGVDQLTAGIKRLGAQLVLADVARRYFKGFNEAEQAAAAVRTLGVDSQALQQRLLSLSNSLGGLYSQTQLVAAAYDVASSGFADTASNAKVLEAAAYGATGGLSDINTVGNAVTSVLNAYGKSADEAGKLVDGFIQTQNDGKIILNEYAKQIGRLAPTAAASGVSIQELNAAISTITAQGVPVEATFTGLNQALVSILKPSKEAEDLAKGLGIQFNEAGLKAKGFGGLLQEVKQKTGGSTTALVQLFGSVDAVKTVLPLTNDNLVSFNKNLGRQANASGVAKDATKELGGTVSSQITKMVNQIGNLSRALDQVLGPTLGSLIGLINIVIAKATEGIMVLGQMFSMSKNTTILKTAIESGDVGTSAPGRVLPGAAELIGEKRTRQLQQQAGGFGKFDSKKFTQLLAQQPEIKKLLGTDKPDETKPNATGGLTAAQQAQLDKLLQRDGKGRTGGKGKTDAERAAEKAEEEALRLKNSLGDLGIERDLKQQIYGIDSRIFEANLLNDKETAIRLEGQKKLAQISAEISKLEYEKLKPQELQSKNQALLQDAVIAQRDTQQELILNQVQAAQQAEAAIRPIIQEGELLKAKLAGTELQYQKELLIRQILKDNPGLRRDEVAAIVTENEALQRQLTQAEQLKQVYSDVGMTIKSGVVDAIQGAIDGTKSLGEVATGILKNIANKVLDIAINFALFGAMSGIGTKGGGLFGLIPGLDKRARGGPVSAGSSYMVGERGPELFTPKHGGSIVPNNALGGGSTNVVVNVDASGSNVQGDQAQSRQLGIAVSAAVQAELVKQQRPGGLLSGTRR